MTDDADQCRIGLGMMSEGNLARRISWEMEQRGWSQERVAKEMTNVGYPLHQSSVSKIINPKDGKRRSISVDDAIGFAKIFGVTLDNLLIPLEAVWDDELRAALIRIEELAQQRETLNRETATLITRIVKLAQAGGGGFFDRHLDAADAAARRRLLDEMHRWGQRLTQQADSSDGLGEDEQVEQLHRIIYGDQPAPGSQR